MLSITPIISTIKKYGIRSCLFNYFSILISDAYVVSFQKSGRTWLRVMLAKIFSLKYGAKKVRLDTQFMTLFKRDPNILFSHAGSTRNDDKLDYCKLFRKKKIIFLVRDPRDDVVSLFHDHTKRNFLYKRNSISDFIRDPDWGLKKIINFMNLWAEEMSKRKEDFLLVKYEDMKKDAYKELRRILNFLSIQASDEMISEAIKYSSFENMRKMEMEKTIDDWRMRPGDMKDPDSYRTRKGKVGSHKEELSQEAIDYINKEIKEKLNPIFKY